MGINYDVDVEIFCGHCTREINNESDIICRTCHEKDVKERMAETNALLEKLLPYVNEATLMKPIEIPGIVAFELREAIRSILN